MIYIVHSMGRVGSRTVYYGLKRAGYRVYHCHYLGRRQNLKLRQLIKRQEVKVISLVREPVKRNISAYFQNFYHDHKVSMDEFMEQYPHRVPLDWFDNEFKRWWGVDVYAEPFPERGWNVYDGRLLVMRTKDIDRVWPDAFRELTGRQAPPLRRENVRKVDEYKRFLREETIPEGYIEMMHNSKYYRHFYA